MEFFTNRLRLRSWCQEDGENFAALNRDPVVMADLGGPLSRAHSDAKLERYIDAFNHFGFGRWAVESHTGRFLGYCGVMLVANDHPLGAHAEIGWRLNQCAWGKGYATEAALFALRDVFQRSSLSEVLAYTAADNLRSQSVMGRLHLQRDRSRDFEMDYGLDRWRGLVWVAKREALATTKHDAKT